MARAGELLSFTGVDDPYEAPVSPDIVCHTVAEISAASIAKILSELEQRQLIPPKPRVEFFV